MNETPILNPLVNNQQITITFLDESDSEFSVNFPISISRKPMYYVPCSFTGEYSWALQLEKVMKE